IGEKSPDAIRMEFHTTQAQDKEARDIIEAAGAAGAGMVAVHPFTRAQSKMWGADKFGALIEKMTALSGVKVFILGGREDAAAAQKYASLPGVVNCAGKLSLGGTAALIKRCSVFVGNDSGPQYFAAYSGVRTCVIYGYTMNSNRWRPKVKKEDFTGLSVAVPCGPCESSVCINRKGHKCMEAISVDMVWERIKQWIM
ncbi:MAG: glycosyltransferase family 9 protein, partial [Spirochaetia bacterium]|nr:glycosyltransferase family 9 protein [Spirochaetia bacterium]